jgi:hypothetical protein
MRTKAQASESGKKDVIVIRGDQENKQPGPRQLDPG